MEHVLFRKVIMGDNMKTKAIKILKIGKSTLNTIRRIKLKPRTTRSKPQNNEWPIFIVF